MKPNQVNILARTMLRDLQQIDHTQEPGLSRQRWSYLQKSDRLDRIHFDLTFLHTVPATNPDMRPLPDSNAARDLSPANALAKPLGEHHEESLHSGKPQSLCPCG